MPVLPDEGSIRVAPGAEPAVLLRLLDHREGDAVLHRAARVLALELHEDRTSGLGLSAEMSTSGVLPIRSSTEP